MTIVKNELMDKYTTFKIGGPADYFVRVKTREELLEAIHEAGELGVKLFVLGGGTNILVGDKGIRAMVIRLEIDTIQLAGYSYTNAVTLAAGAGVLVNRLVRYTLDHGLSGLENFLGQPGTVGGAVYINAHNMWKNDFFGSHIIEAELVDRAGHLTKVPQSYFRFGYDQSRIQKTKEIVVSVVVRLSKMTNVADAWNTANEVASYRQKTQPYGIGSAGCTFRNISVAQALRLDTPNATRSAGYLIDQCGLKGTRTGNAAIARDHANFIVNCGGAKATDVIQLIRLIKAKVKQRFGIVLHEEIVKVGEF